MWSVVNSLGSPERRKLTADRQCICVRDKYDGSSCLCNPSCFHHAPQTNTGLKSLFRGIGFVLPVSVWRVVLPCIFKIPLPITKRNGMLQKALLAYYFYLLVVLT